MGLSRKLLLCFEFYICTETKKIQKRFGYSKNSCNFATTVPTTLPEDQRTRVGLLLLVTKQPLDYPDILAMMKERGLIISDDDKVISCLRVISYFRLANYFHPMEADKERLE